MRDKTRRMNNTDTTASIIGEGAEKGFADAGKPMTRRAYKRNQMEDAHLLGNNDLQEFENPDGSLEGKDIGGFLPRNNYSDRF